MKKSKIIWIIPLLLTAFLSPIYAQSAPGDIQSEVEAEMMCLCGCGQTVKNCPHENCGFAVPARKQIATLVNEGKTKKEIFDFFVNKYGEEILSAPRKQGFNLIGYIMPFAALLAAAALIMVIIKSWTGRGIKDEEETLPEARQDKDPELDRLVEDELKEID